MWSITAIVAGVVYAVRVGLGALTDRGRALMPALEQVALWVDAREPDRFVSPTFGYGRELFAHMRAGVGAADLGASVLF